MIYFALNDLLNPTEVKIGYTSRRIWFRLHELGEKVSLIGLMPGSKETEKEMHKRFESQWLGVRHEHGREWFKWTGDVKDFVSNSLPELRRLGGRNWDEVEKCLMPASKGGFAKFRHAPNKEFDQIHLPILASQIDVIDAITEETYAQIAAIRKERAAASTVAGNATQTTQTTQTENQCRYVGPSHWPYVSLRLDVRQFPNQTPYRESTMWVSRCTTDGAGRRTRNQSELYYRLSAVVYGRLLLAVENLLRPSKRRDGVTGMDIVVHPSETAIASAKEAMKIMAPLYDFIAHEYASLWIANGGTATEAWEALAQDIREAHDGGTELPKPLASEREIRQLERLEDDDDKSLGQRQWLQSWGRDAGTDWTTDGESWLSPGK